MKIGKQDINLNTLDQQVGANGKPYRMSKLEKIANDYIYTFRYIGTNKFFSFKVDSNNNFKGLIK